MIADNKEAGKTFEETVLKRAKYNGLLALKNPVSARYINHGRLIPIASELDFKFIKPDGTCGFFDCKNFEGDQFVFSKINADQLERAVLYNDWNVPSGFIIYFQAVGRIVFFSGRMISTKGERSSFFWKEGIVLGDLQSFDLKLVMET